MRRTFPKLCYFPFFRIFGKTVIINLILFKFPFENKIICILQNLLSLLFTKKLDFSRLFFFELCSVEI